MNSSKAKKTAKRADEPVSLGIIGVSGYAGALIDALQTEIDGGRAFLQAAAVRTRERSQERCADIEARGGVVFSDWRRMLDQYGDQLDCVIIPTAIQSHREMAVEVLQRGLNTFLEKPLAATVEDARAICEAAVRSDAGLIIGYQDLYAPSTRRIKALLLDQTLGEIKGIHICGLWPRKSTYYARNSWAGRLHAGGEKVFDSPLNNAFAHYITLPLFWIGDTLEASAGVCAVEGSVYRARDIESFDTASIRIETAAKVPLNIHVSHSCEEYFGPEIRIEGTEGCLTWHAEKYYRIERGTQVEERALLPTVELRKTMLAHVVRWIRGEKVPVCAAEQAIEQTRVIDLIHTGLEIMDIPLPEIKGAEEAPYVEGLSNRFRTLYQEGRILDVTDASWAGAIRRCEGLPAVSGNAPATLERLVFAGGLSA